MSTPTLHRCTRRGQAGFTLAEVMVASAVFTMIMGSVIALNIFSARSTSGVSRMLEIGSKANILNTICNEVKNAQTAAVQNFSNNTFSAVALGTAQQGNALKVVVPDGTNTQTIYYYVDSTGDMWRWNSSQSTNSTRRYLTDLTNSVVFYSKDFTGATISNSIARTLIEMDVFIVDENPKNFRQILNLRSSAEIRNH